MFGNFPTNDDWIFVRQIQAFSQNIFTLNARLDPSFIAQGFLGLGWEKLFGISFLSLQILTFLITIATAFLFYKTLLILNVKKNLAVVTSLLLFFNPLVFTSAFSFMTDNYFAFFLILSVFAYLKYRQNSQLKYFAVSLIGAALATLTRQIGLFIFIAIFSQELKTKKAFFTALTAILTFAIVYFWPRYESNPMFIDPQYLGERFLFMLLSIHYFPLFLFPIFFGLKVKKNWKLLIPLTLAFATFLFIYDFFPVGNVLYLEGLHIKSDFRPIFSLFDNLFFKIPFALVIGYSFSILTTFVAQNFNLFRKNTFLFTLFALNIGILFVSSDYYDRYLIPSFIILALYFIPEISQHFTVTKSVVVFLALIIFISVTLQWDFSQKRNLMWQQAYMLQKEKNIFSQISLNDTYSNYINAQMTNDFTGLTAPRSFGFKCYVQNYTTGTFWLENLENYIENHYLDNPRPYLSKKKNMSRIKNNLDSLIYNESYFSPIYNLVGKKTFVGAWCI